MAFYWLCTGFSLPSPSDCIRGDFISRLTPLELNPRGGDRWRLVRQVSRIKGRQKTEFAWRREAINNEVCARAYGLRCSFGLGVFRPSNCLILSAKQNVSRGEKSGNCCASSVRRDARDCRSGAD
jgi:hypothetical protein